MAVSAKIVALFVGVVCAAVSQVNAGPMDSCMQETGATRKMLVDFMQGENDSREVKCFFKCTMMAHGKMNSDGSYNFEAMKKVQTPALYEVASTTCANFESTDLCEKAYAHIACLRDHAKDELSKVMMHSQS